MARRAVIASLFLLLLAAMGMEALAAAASDEPDQPVIPPRMITAAGGYDDCQASNPLPAGEVDPIRATLTIAPDGSLTKIALKESAPDWMVELTTCVLQRTRFLPAMTGSVGVIGSASLFIEVAAATSGQTAITRVQHVGPLITPPRMMPRSGEPLYCFPLGVDPRDAAGRQIVKLLILPDGSVGDLQVPVGSPDWLPGSARCMLGYIRFRPGTRDGIPVTSEATLPIAFNPGRAVNPQHRVTPPRLLSTDEELEAASRACYPTHLAIASIVHFKFEIGNGGIVRDPEVMLGSGDSQLDEAATCMLRKLRFAPMLVGSERLRSLVTWQLSVSPPRRP